MGRQKDILGKLERTFRMRHTLLRQALAECLGTLILVMFSCAAVAQWMLSGGSHGTFLSVNFAVGGGAALGVLVSGPVSGGHLNPAVTFALCLLGREPWRKFPLFFFFQTLGAFLAALVVFCIYFDAIWDFGHGELLLLGNNATAGIFATYPSEHLSTLNGFTDQVIGTASLVTCVLAIIDPLNNSVPRGFEAFPVGFVVTVIGLSMGFNSGYAINPARDLGPRIFTALAGWGFEVFTVNNYWSLIPIGGPFVGAMVAVIVYQLMIGYHLSGDASHKRKKKQEDKEERLTLPNIRANEEAA
ncbi:aquaporin-3-like [Dunckerocampus dactyliophorus]|uniref:aquaporin-3-like n=1 Tax=Dunckerocampus dactyliophorus TaxID=161453 RepID=UPI002404DA13|nr:aquaporin-3-like [Dunckerocampus dactyliophorus]